MKQSHSKKVILAISMLYFLWVGFDVLYSDGEVGVTKRGPSPYGCICHGSQEPTDTVLVWVTGPETVLIGSTNEYTLTMIGGPLAKGGYNAAVGSGTLIPFDSTSKIVTGELTHSSPKESEEIMAISWKFYYQAPLTAGLDTIYSVGNSVNGDGNPTGDMYNFGIDFYIAIVDSSLGVTKEALPTDFTLYQNYPNPFNPTTKIRFTIREAGFTTLHVYNVLGEKIATLVKGNYQSGSYEVDFTTNNLSGGIYLCQLQTEYGSMTRKMVYSK